MFGSRNRDRVHVSLFENPAKVYVSRGSLAHLLLRTAGELLENIAVHTADMRDTGGVPIRLERREMGVGAAIKTDNGKVEAVIRTKDLAITICSTCNGYARRAGGKCIEKLTSCNHHFSLILISRKSQP